MGIVVNMSKAVRVAATILLASCCMVILCEGAWEEDPSRWEETTLTAPRHSDDGALNEMEDQQASDQLNIKKIANTNPIVEEAPTAGAALSEVDDYKPRSSDDKAAGTSAKRRTRRRRRNKKSVALSEVVDDTWFV